MRDGPLEEARERWNRLADDWRIQVGADGDSNRRLNSDPVLWEFVGDVRGLTVLDAGCGTGYLSSKLRDRGARIMLAQHSDDLLLAEPASLHLRSPLPRSGFQQRLEERQGVTSRPFQSAPTYPASEPMLPAQMELRAPRSSQSSRRRSAIF